MLGFKVFLEPSAPALASHTTKERNRAGCFGKGVFTPSDYYLRRGNGIYSIHNLARCRCYALADGVGGGSSFRTTVPDTVRHSVLWCHMVCYAGLFPSWEPRRMKELWLQSCLNVATQP